MNQYGKTAVRAVQISKEHKTDVRQAWDVAAQEVVKSEESRKKGCPRAAFLGLCEEGLVKGIPAKKYINKESLNKNYAIEAIEILKNQPELKNDKAKLWEQIVGKEKAHNSQMDVVVSLFENGLINV